MTPRPSDAPRRYQWRQTIRINSDGGRLPTEANARLYAEAPAMLEALERLAIQLEVAARHFASETLMQTAIETRAVIQRVKGEETRP